MRKLISVITASLIGATIPALAARLVPPGANVNVVSCHSQFGMQIGSPQNGLTVVRIWQPSKGEFGKPKLVEAPLVSPLDKDGYAQGDELGPAMDGDR